MTAFITLNTKIYRPTCSHRCLMKLSSPDAASSIATLMTSSCHKKDQGPARKLWRLTPTASSIVGLRTNSLHHHHHHHPRISSRRKS